MTDLRKPMHTTVNKEGEWDWPAPLPPCADWRDMWDGCEKDMGCGARCTGNRPRKKEDEQ
jgi:hypothetical protein